MTSIGSAEEHKHFKQDDTMIQTTTANNIDDVIRDDILRYLYELHRKARSPRSAGKGIRDLQRVAAVAGLSSALAQATELIAPLVQ